MAVKSIAQQPNLTVVERKKAILSTYVTHSSIAFYRSVIAMFLCLTNHRKQKF